MDESVIAYRAETCVRFFELIDDHVISDCEELDFVHDCIYEMLGKLYELTGEGNGG